MNIKIKRFLAIVVAVISTAACSTPSFAQRPPATPAQKERRTQQMKSWVESDAKSHPKWRMLVTFRDGSQAAGRIREVHEKDFVLQQDAGFPDRTIAFEELAIAPQKITPMAEKIAEYTGDTIVIVVFFPLIVFMGLTGQWD